MIVENVDGTEILIIVIGIDGMYQYISLRNHAHFIGGVKVFPATLISQN